MTGNKPLQQPLLGAPRLPVAILDHRGKRKGKEVSAKDLGNRGTVAGEEKLGEEDRCNQESKGVVQRRTVLEENNFVRRSLKEFWTSFQKKRYLLS
mmetsp:Transcript_4879/g.31243  ORF Transcript_4879/g.31243 Transcript_4879/m.31243 type:complete len:96 (-) Transcript_4879:2052-2339(-)